MAISGMNILLHLVNAVSRKLSQLFAVKKEKHNLVKFLVQTELDSISDTILQAIQGENILPAEFYKKLQEIEKYHKLKEEIRRQNKAQVRRITKEQREEFLEQRRKEDKEDFLRKIAGISVTEGANVI